MTDLFILNDDPYVQTNIQEKYKWMVIDYWEGDYEGGGYAVGLTKDGQELHEYCLSHCSCYGPLDDPPDVIDVKRYTDTSNDVLGLLMCGNAVEDKIRELLGGG